MKTMTRCKSCDAEILWSRTINNKAIPLDVEKVYGGNIILEAEGALARVVKPNISVKRYVSHFSTCPNAKRHRKP